MPQLRDRCIQFQFVLGLTSGPSFNPVRNMNLRKCKYLPVNIHGGPSAYLRGWSSALLLDDILHLYKREGKEDDIKTSTIQNAHQPKDVDQEDTYQNWPQNNSN